MCSVEMWLVLLTVIRFSLYSSSLFFLLFSGDHGLGWCDSVAQWLGCWTHDQQVVGLTRTFGCNSGQVVHKLLPLTKQYKLAPGNEWHFMNHMSQNVVVHPLGLTADDWETDISGMFLDEYGLSCP